MKQKRKNRQKLKPILKKTEIFAPQYKNLMFEKRVHRGFVASMKTKQKLGKNHLHFYRKRSQILLPILIHSWSYTCQISGNNCIY